MDLLGGHPEAFRREYESKVLDCIAMEFTFIGTSVQSVLSELAENFFNVFPITVRVVGEDEDVVEVDNDADVQEVLENVVHEPLKCGRGVGESERHHEPFEGSVSCSERGLSLIALRDTYQVISMMEVNLSVDTSFARGMEEVGNERQGISVLLGDPVEGAIIDAETKRTILFLDE